MDNTKLIFSDLPDWELLPDLGLYMDQLLTFYQRQLPCSLTHGEMTKSMVNNYVKSKLIPRPSGKKYDRPHIAALLMVGVLKQALSMDDIHLLLENLCAGDIQSGYNRFIDVYRQILRNFPSIPEGLCTDDPLFTGLYASLYTLRTGQLLSSGRFPENSSSTGGSL